MRLKETLQKGTIDQLMGKAAAFTIHPEGTRIVAISTSPIETALLIEPDRTLPELQEIIEEIDLGSQLFYRSRATLPSPARLIFDSDVIYAGNVRPRFADETINRDLREYCEQFELLFKQFEEKSYGEEKKQRIMQEILCRKTIHEHLRKYRIAKQQEIEDSEGHLTLLEDFLMLNGANESQINELLNATNRGKYAIAYHVDYLAAMLTENYEYLAKIRRLQPILSNQPATL